MSTNMIQLEAMPVHAARPKGRYGRGGYNGACATNHAHLTFDFNTERIECLDCGLEWRDFLGECKVPQCAATK